MHWTHDAHPGRGVRLAYCLNLHAADDLDGTIAGMRAVTLPLRDRLAQGRPFGVGVYLPDPVARELATPERPRPGPALERLARFFADEGLAPFTFNAFPYGGFHREGLKESVYRPTWLEADRVRFTCAVAQAAAYFATATAATPSHVSISTHPGTYGAWVTGPEDLEQCARNMGACVLTFARIEAGGGPRIVLSLEAEPLASAGDSAELAEFLALARPIVAAVVAADGAWSASAARTLATRHLGTCLDCCHSAVEFEAPAQALALATRAEGPLGKLQFSSALALPRPAAAPEARGHLVAMAEPVYLHQVTGRAGARRLHCADLPELDAALARDGSEWLECDEWRCHFHVPVDLDHVGGLSTTRAHADAILAAALGSPERWGTPDLHVEIETYTWDILPGPARGAGDLVDGLEREYTHVIAQIESSGWKRA
ncbi:MAG: hypothetical protein E2O39_12355 [Planctomycetota bacterium]|nr:MAG: hypothetical protein E2O39_12355 [Planctomycetota bacterium]